MRRRDVLRQAALLLPLAAACTPAPPAPPATPGATAPPSSSYRPPTYVPFQGPPADIPGTLDGLPPGYRVFPKSLATSVQSPPGRGGDVTILTFTNAPAPVPLEHNGAWQEVNKQIGATLKINAVGAPDYLTKLNTSISGGALADIFYASVIGTGLQNMPDFLASQCADLTPFLSGDAIKDYPNLANFPTFRWPYGVFNGRLYAVPAATITGQALLAKGRVLDDNGIGDFKNADEFMAAAKQLTKPGVQYAIGGTGSGYNSWNPLGWFMGVFRVPNDWRNDGGKLTKDIETDEFRAALAYVRSLWDTGVMNPDSPSMNLTQAAAAWYAGKNILWQNGYFSFQLAWDRAKVQSQDADFRPRIVTPFAFDGGRAVHLLGTTSDSLTAFRKAPADRIRELLGIVNYMVAPFGTRENVLLNYGVQDRDFTFDAAGSPVLSQTGTAEVTTFPIWKMSASPPVLFDPNDAAFAQVASDATAHALSVGVASPVAGLYSNTASRKAALLNQPLTDGLYNIMFGRDSTSALDGLIAQWRANGGDAIRSELQDALQKRG